MEQEFKMPFLDKKGHFGANEMMKLTKCKIGKITKPPQNIHCIHINKFGKTPFVLKRRVRYV
ncbi:hypothetical protein ACWV26_07595 [Rummeliibacillus sp. JY-2-4R]